MHRISKSFDFCYGHRVWSQTLDEDLSCNAPCACRHLHGHQGKVIIELEAEILVAGMVTDFHHLNWFKRWLDDTLDHKMILDVKDPVLPTLFKTIYPPAQRGVRLDHTDAEFWVRTYIDDEFSYCVVSPDMLKLRRDKDWMSADEIAVAEGLVLVTFVPTSENFSKFIFQLVKKRLEDARILQGRVGVSRVTFFETPKSKSEYTEGDIGSFGGTG